MSEIKDSQFTPKYGDYYWVIDTVGNVEIIDWRDREHTDCRRYDIGNCYRTKEEAEYVRDNQITLTNLRRYVDEHNQSDFDKLDTTKEKFHFEIDLRKGFVCLFCSECQYDIYSQLPLMGSLDMVDETAKEIGSLNIAKLFFTYKEWQRVESEFNLSRLV